MKTRASTIQFKTSPDGKPDRGLVMNMYIFKRNGELLTQTPYGKGEFTVSIDPKEAARARIFIGPELEGKRTSEITIETMEKVRAYEPGWEFNPRKRVYDLLPIPDYLWKWWYWCKCRVRGQVVKPVETAGVTHKMPVCHARVHICEVDPIILLIYRLPDPLVFRLRDELIKIVEERIPRPPIPDPPPFKFDPGVIDPSPEAIAKLNIHDEVVSRKVLSEADSLMFNPQPDPPADPKIRKVANLKLTEKVEIPTERLMTASKSEVSENPGSTTYSLSINTKGKLLSNSAETVKKTLVDHAQILQPFLCWWPWLWPYFYKCDEIAVAETDSQGHFDTDIWFPCFGDHPDLYFWVEYSIGGTWTTVYKPPIRCYTYWNYVCGSEVTITITDPRVPWCGDPPTIPGLQLAVMTIGNNISLHEIQPASAGLNQGLTYAGQPFGGKLEPHVWFGDDLVSAGVKYYKWSYRQITEGDGSTTVSDSWHAMDRQVIRHYAVIDPSPPFDLNFETYVLGPKTVGTTHNLFEINPAAPAGSYGWAPMVDARENTASAFLLSHQLQGGDALAAAGKYELKLELFNNSGNLVNLTNKGIMLKVPTISAPFGPGTVPTTAPGAEHLILDGSGKVIGFKMVIRIDNNPCSAFIYETNVDGVNAGPCGFIEYSPGTNALLRFRAYHPNNFAKFRFRTVKGSSGYQNVACSPLIGNPLPLVSASPVNGFVRNSLSIYSKSISVSALVGTCPGGMAAFSENLYVYAMANDGWHELDYLDAGATPKAFALMPSGS